MKAEEMLNADLERWADERVAKLGRRGDPLVELVWTSFLEGELEVRARVLGWKKEGPQA